MSKFVKLGKVAKIYSGGTPSRNNPICWNGDIPWIKTTHIQGSNVNSCDVDEFITQYGLQNSSAKIAQRGTILMAMYGQGKTRGQVAILNIDASINQACCAIEVFPDHCSKYVFQYLKSKYEDIRRLSNDGGQKNLSAGIIKKFNVYLPSYEEQKSIVETLQTWDKAIEKTEALIDAKERQFGWLRSRIVAGTKKSKTAYFGDLLKESRIPDAQNDPKKRLTVRLHLKGVDIREYRGTKSDGATQYYVRKAEQLVYGKQNIFRGSIGIVPQSLDGYSSSQDIPAFDIAKSVDAEWLFWYMSRPSFYEKLEHFSAGSGSKRLHPKELFKMQISIPPLEEQKRIANILNTARQEINLLKKLAERYRTQKRGLMQKLLTGKVKL